MLAAPPRAYVYPRLSPDGTRVVLDARDEEDDLWVWDLTRETLTRLTFAAAADRFGVWTPDGQRVVFTSWRDGFGSTGARPMGRGRSNASPKVRAANFPKPSPPTGRGSWFGKLADVASVAPAWICLSSRSTPSDGSHR